MTNVLALVRRLAIGLAFAPAFFLAEASHAAVGDFSGTVVKGDFDDDGSLEIVVSSPENDCGKGSVYLREVSGTVTTWDRDTSGVLGTAACDDYFGAALAVGDFDGDGYDDLAIGAPGADDASQDESGAVHVLYGSSGGLTASGDQLWHQDSTGIADDAEEDDWFGDALTTGDFDCDGYADLSIGVPREDHGPRTDTGAVHVLYGSSGGITSVGDFYCQDDGVITEWEEEGDFFGAALVAGNFNGDDDSSLPCEDLAIGVPNEVDGMNAAVGVVHVVFSTGTSGLSTTTSQILYQDLSGVVDDGEADDRFGERLRVIDDNGDSYDDLAVVVPGDTCTPGHGEGVHALRGSSTGITTTGNHLECSSYLCNLGPEPGQYWCRSNSPPVYASSGGDSIRMFVGDDVVWAGAGADVIKGSYGNDVIFGGAGADILDGGGGLDIQIGGEGDDVFILDLDCAVGPGEIIDGGPDDDTVQSHLTEYELELLGVQFVSIESFVLTDGENPLSDAGCVVPPFEEGPFLRPKVELSWDDLPEEYSVWSTTEDPVDLRIVNVTDDSLAVDLTFRLLVRGWPVEYAPTTISLSSHGETVYPLDLEDFIPGGIDPGTVPPDLLELPTSAVLTVQAEVTISSEHAGLAFAPIVYGHLENGDEAVLYRKQALEGTYYNGDLVAWRTGARYSPGPSRVLLARIVPIPTP